MLKSKGSFVVKNKKVEDNSEFKEEHIVHGRYLWYFVFECLISFGELWYFDVFKKPLYCYTVDNSLIFVKNY